MLTVSIRPFREGDSKEVYAMLKSTEEVHVAGLTYSEKAVQGWSETRAQDVVLVAEVNGAVSGFIATKLGDPEPGGAYIDGIIVKPEYRGKGIGQQLLEQCISSLEGRDVSFIHLHVRPEFSLSVNFWEKNGFKGKEPLLWMYKEI